MLVSNKLERYPGPETLCVFGPGVRSGVRSGVRDTRGVGPMRGQAGLRQSHRACWLLATRAGTDDRDVAVVQDADEWMRHAELIGILRHGFEREQHGVDVAGRAQSTCQSRKLRGVCALPSPIHRIAVVTPRSSNAGVAQSWAANATPNPTRWRSWSVCGVNAALSRIARAMSAGARTVAASCIIALRDERGDRQDVRTTCALLEPATHGDERRQIVRQQRERGTDVIGRGAGAGERPPPAVPGP